MSSESDARELVRRWCEKVFNEKNLPVCDELMADRYVEHAIATFGQTAPGEVNGPEHMRATARWLFDQFPDLRMDIEALVGEGDTVRRTSALRRHEPRPCRRRRSTNWREILGWANALVPSAGWEARRALGNPGRSHCHASARGPPAARTAAGQPIMRSTPVSGPPNLAVNRSKHERWGPLPAGLGSYCVSPRAHAP